jgi:hypothetical protein
MCMFMLLSSATYYDDEADDIEDDDEDGEGFNEESKYPHMSALRRQFVRRAKGGHDSSDGAQADRSIKAKTFRRYVTLHVEAAVGLDHDDI